MTDHGARAHAHWSASATARNWHCPGALTLADLAPPETSSIHADTGTAVHQIAERMIRGGERDAGPYLDTVEPVKSRKITIDEELVESAQTYVDYAWSRIDAAVAEGGRFWLEERFRLDDLDPPFEAGGTGDLVIWFPKQQLIEIADLKNGRGVVDARDNPQLRTYALGAMLSHQDLAVERIMSTIVQPRAPHKDGRIRSETFSATDLLEWTFDLLAAMKRSVDARRAYAEVSGDLTMDVWAEKWLQPGKCKFCPAEGFCPALKRKAQKMVAVFYDAGDRPKIGNSPADMTPEAVAAVLDEIDLIEDWIKAVRGLAHRLAEAGTPPPNYILVEKIGNRKWAAADEVVIKDLRIVADLDDAQIFEEPKLRSVAQIEKVLGAKRKKEIENMWLRPVTGTNLVREDKTEREPAKSSVEKFFTR